MLKSDGNTVKVFVPENVVPVVFVERSADAFAVAVVGASAFAVAGASAFAVAVAVADAFGSALSAPSF